MRRATWTFVLVLMSAVVCVSAVPQTDLPETPYNEVDTPVNQAPPVVPGIRLTRPDVAVVLLTRQVTETGRGVNGNLCEHKSVGTPIRYTHCPQDLLCTLLI
jgi:hypothetical protein